MDGALPGTEPSPGANEGDDHSTTNIQEEGVGESDVMKNDGTYLYIVSGNTLKIVRAVPADQMTVLSTTELASYPREIYLKGDMVVALADSYDHVSNGNVTEVIIIGWK